MWWTEFFDILGYFLPFYLPNSPKNQNFEKMKKTSGDIIILRKCTKNEDHMMHGSWDMKRDRIFCHFGPTFAFLLLTTKKIKILKKWKKTPWDIIILHMYTIKDNHMMYGSWIIKHNTEFFVILSYFLHFYPPNNPKNQNLEKMKKNPWRYHHFTIVYQKSWSYAILFLRYGVWQM